jgi:hypothetical protein
LNGEFKKLCAGPTFLVTAPPPIVGVPPASLIHRVNRQAAARRIQGSIGPLERGSGAASAGVDPLEWVQCVNGVYRIDLVQPVTMRLCDPGVQIELTHLSYSPASPHPASSHTVTVSTRSLIDTKGLALVETMVV